MAEMTEREKFLDEWWWADLLQVADELYSTLIAIRSGNANPNLYERADGACTAYRRIKPDLERDAKLRRVDGIMQKWRQRKGRLYLSHTQVSLGTPHPDLISMIDHADIVRKGSDWLNAVIACDEKAEPVWQERDEERGVGEKKVWQEKGK